MPPKRLNRATLLLAGAAALCAATVALAPGEGRAQSRSDASISSVAFVNGDVITNFDVDQRARLLGAMGAPPQARTPDLALQAMIDDRLKRSAARSAGIAIPPEQIDEAMANFAGNNNLTVAQLEERMRRAGVADESLRQFVESEVLWNTLIRRDYGPRADVTDLDLEDEIEAEGLDKKLTFELGEIAIPSRGNEEAVIAQVERIAADINGGADFGAMARKYSRSPTAPRGGRMGAVPSDRLPPPLVAELRDLQPGHVTRPLSVPGGVALLTVFNVTETPIELSEQDRERIRERMRQQRLGRYGEGRLQELRADAYIDRR